jgi:hypothetical protein
VPLDVPDVPLDVPDVPLELVTPDVVPRVPELVPIVPLVEVELDVVTPKEPVPLRSPGPPTQAVATATEPSVTPDATQNHP